MIHGRRWCYACHTPLPLGWRDTRHAKVCDACQRLVDAAVARYLGMGVR